MVKNNLSDYISHSRRLNLDCHVLSELSFNFLAKYYSLNDEDRGNYTPITLIDVNDTNHFVVMDSEQIHYLNSDSSVIVYCDIRDLFKKTLH